MSPVELSRGGNAALGPNGIDPAAIVVGVTWTAVDKAPDYDVCAVVCGPDRRVRGDHDFLFWDNLESQDRAIFLRQPASPRPSTQDTAQLLISLHDLPSEVERVVLTLSTITPDADLSEVSDLRTRVFLPGSGDTLVTFASQRPVTTGEACLIVAEVYRHQGRWKVRAVAQGYQSGLAGLGKDYGVNIT